MQMRALGKSGLKTAPLVLGGNVFGWTADKATSFDILDALIDAGFNAVDTANVYSRWVPDHSGGESETVIGEWFAAHGKRDKTLLITKVGMDMGEGRKGLKADYIVKACEASLKRLQTDHIDLYLSHSPDEDTPIDETLEGHQRLIDAGKVRAIGGSNYDGPGLKAAVDAAGDGKARYEVLQPHYNLLVRDQYEGAREDVCVAEGLGVISYFSLASGFLTGKYRTEDDLKKSPRGGQMKSLLEGRGPKVLAALDKVAARHGATQAQVALAWLMARPSITAPIASATSVAQLQEILPAASMNLSTEDMADLDI
ncbi:MAG: aldo/keto reductase [Alphaproteobacteria bacterium]|nr:aldo/keto reductase [Alphaproteobacteria bacterium]MBU2083419.1 aldo/keto reductase [Alphaproteobacteria bacterium]MBU2143616.1 aldo/keto reductase [Alphaproteobacteria bacterium]MBU2195983.1 aldo/keto reductase [Alphaproteobacteria bacterium]